MRARDSIYRWDGTFVLVRELDRSREPEPASGVEVSVLQPGEIDQLVHIAYRGRETIERRLAEGQTCVIGKLRGSIIHYSWLTSRPEYAREIESELPLGPDERYVYDCRTLRHSRGFGAFAAALARIVNLASDDCARRVVALVASQNVASLRAFEKAGFRIREKIHVRRILWVLRRTVIEQQPA